MDDEGWYPAHAAEPGQLTVGSEQFVHGVVVDPIPSIGPGVGSRSRHRQQKLATQPFAVAAIGEAMFENQVLPLLQQGRGALPIERVLKDDDVVGEQSLLFTGHIDVEVGVLLVEIAEGHPRQIPDRLH